MLVVNWSPPITELLANHASKMPSAVKDVLSRLGVMGESYAKVITPVDTANLRKRIGWKIAGGARPALHIGTNVTYAPYVLTDTGPFIIRAKNKKVLAWVTKGNIRPSTPEGWRIARERGVARYAKEVMYPGGKDVLGKTEDFLENKIPGVVRSVLNAHGIGG